MKQVAPLEVFRAQSAQICDIPEKEIVLAPRVGQLLDSAEPAVGHSVKAHSQAQGQLGCCLKYEERSPTQR